MIVCISLQALSFSAFVMRMDWRKAAEEVRLGLLLCPGTVPQPSGRRQKGNRIRSLWGAEGRARVCLAGQSVQEQPCPVLLGPGPSRTAKTAGRCDLQWHSCYQNICCGYVTPGRDPGLSTQPSLSFTAMAAVWVPQAQSMVSGAGPSPAVLLLDLVTGYKIPCFTPAPTQEAPGIEPGLPAGVCRTWECLPLPWGMSQCPPALGRDPQP